MQRYLMMLFIDFYYKNNENEQHKLILKKYLQIPVIILTLESEQ